MSAVEVGRGSQNLPRPGFSRTAGQPCFSRVGFKNIGEIVPTRVVPVTRDQAQAFIAEHHRHNRRPVGWLFGAGLERGGELLAVGMAGRPSARAMQDGTTIEVTRVCTLGTRNAASRIYGALSGIRSAVLGGLAVVLELSGGPLTGLRLRVDLAALNDLPERLDFETGCYLRWLDDGRQVHTVDGAASFRWQDEP